MLNKCIFAGRLVAAPELRHTQSDKAVCNFSIAVTEGYGDRKETSFPSCVAWNKTAEFAAKLPKGTLITVVSKFRDRSWVDKDGNKRKSAEFIVDELIRMEWDSLPDDLPKVKIEPDRIPDQSYSDMYPDEELPF